MCICRVCGYIPLFMLCVYAVVIPDSIVWCINLLLMEMLRKPEISVHGECFIFSLKFLSTNLLEATTQIFCFGASLVIVSLWFLT